MRRAIPAASGAPLSGRDRELRLLEYAIAASIALHVLALAALQRVTPTPAPAAAVPEQISARLVESQPAPDARAEPVPAASTDAPPPAPAPLAKTEPEPKPASKPAVERQAPRAEVEQRAPTPAPAAMAAPMSRPQPKPDRAPQAAARPATQPKPEPRTVRPAEDHAPSAPPAGERALSAPPTASARAAPAAAVPPGASVDADVLSRYRLQLISAARRYKRYPRAAIDNQWEGAAEVAMVVGANGRIRDMTISRSSGHELLDRQAIDMFRKAKPLVPIPPALRGREFRVTLKAIYSLRDPGA